MLFPYTVQHFFPRPLFLLTAASLLLIPAAVIAGGTENKKNEGDEMLLISLPLKVEDAIISSVAGSGDGEDGDDIRHQTNDRPIAGSSKTPDNSGEDIGYLGAGLLGAAIGAGLGSYYGTNGAYQQGYYPEYYGGVPYASVGYVGNPSYIRPPTVYRPPRPDSFYPGPGPAYGDYFGDDANDGLAGFGGSYPGYYSELLTGKTQAPEKVTSGSKHPTMAMVGGSTGHKKQPTTGGTSGYPIDWSAVAEAYYQDMSSRADASSLQSETEDETVPIFYSDSYPLIFDDNYYY